MAKRAKAIVFDVGGVFRDSKDVMYDSFIKSFSKFNFQLSPNLKKDTIYHLRGFETFNDLLHCCKALYITQGNNLEHYLDAGVVGEENLNQQIQNFNFSNNDIEILNNIASEFKALFASPENKDKIRMMDRTEEGLHILNTKLNYKLGVLSNGTIAGLERDLGFVFKYFHFVIAEAKKPDPTIYLNTLQTQLHISPSETVYVGDAVSDVVMAKKAGSISVALLSGMGLEDHLRKADPDYVFKTFSEFVDYVEKNGI